MSDSEEDYADYGTPLDPLDEDAVPKKKPFRLEEIIAKNNKQRFHGAFTGGFSAGFFNTVGSLEGWKPSNFKSSRSEKAEKKTQKPEDFMDEEDMGEHGIAPKVLRATGDYTDHTASRKRERYVQPSGPIPGEPVLQQLIQPVRETVGVKLLKRMGWKPGQGVGPRLTRKEKRLHRQEIQRVGQKVYGCSLPVAGSLDSGGDSEESSDEDVTDLTFAPNDYEPFLVKAKDNCFGLGYSGLEKRSVLSGNINFQRSSLVMNEKNKKVSISGQAFGVGALEEEDEDIYAPEDMSQYDFSLGSSETLKKIEGNKCVMNRTRVAEEPLEGFVLAANPISRRKFFPPPVLPSNFEPIHKTRKSRFEPASQQNTEEDIKKKGLQRHALSSSDRSIILNDKQLSSLPVLEKNECEEKKNLAAVASKITEKLSSSPSQALFRPFAAYPEKQKRYEQYVSLVKAGRKGEFLRLQPLDMTEWQRDQELAEFERAERLASFMDDRFVPESAGSYDTTQERQPPASEAAARAKMFGKLTRERIVWKPTSLLCKRFNVPEPEVGTSAPTGRKKGVSKFSVFDFLDAANHNSRSTGENLDSAAISEGTASTPVALLDSGRVSDEQGEDLVSIDTAVSSSGGNMQETINQEMDFDDSPSKMDLYKAVFLSSSEESESEENDSRTKQENETESKTQPDAEVPSSSNQEFTTQPSTQTHDPFLSAPATTVNILRNTSPPRGLFANLDLDAINQQIREAKQIRDVAVPDSTSDVTKVNTETVMCEPSSTVTTSIIEVCDVYGPSLPSVPLSSVSRKSEPSPPVVEPSSFVWVEKKKKSSHKNRHKKDHKKSSKHKKHKKHKKKH